MILTNKWAGLFFVLILNIFIICRGYSLKLPSILFFPVSPNYSFTLFSSNSNSIQATLKIALPDIDNNENQNFYYLIWDVHLGLSGEDLNYELNFIMQTNGDISLSAIGDETASRPLEPGVLVFPKIPVFNDPIPIGENITLRYIKNYGSLFIKESDKTYMNVTQANLTMNNRIYSLYFTPDYGLVAVKSGKELFIQK